MGREKKHVSLNVGTGGGARYERFLTSNTSVGANVYWSFIPIIGLESEIGAFGRYYFWNGLFAELGLGFYNHESGDAFQYEGATIKWLWTTVGGFGLDPGLGYKIDVAKPGGFFIEPGITIPITLGVRTWGEGDSKVDYGFGVGVGIGIY